MTENTEYTDATADEFDTTEVDEQAEQESTDSTSADYVTAYRAAQIVEALLKEKGHDKAPSPQQLYSEMKRGALKHIVVVENGKEKKRVRLEDLKDWFLRYEAGQTTTKVATEVLADQFRELLNS